MFSWEKSIELEILNFVLSMARHMDQVARNGQPEVRNSAKNYMEAYITIAEYIIEQINLRNATKKYEKYRQNFTKKQSK